VVTGRHRTAEAEQQRVRRRRRLVDAHDMRVVQVRYDYTVGSHKPELMGWLVFSPSLETPRASQAFAATGQFFKEHGRSDLSREHGSHDHGSRLLAAVRRWRMLVWVGVVRARAKGGGRVVVPLGRKTASVVGARREKKTRLWFWHV
jgi:hypothetical protein